jgi:hypothetical protein
MSLRSSNSTAVPIPPGTSDSRFEREVQDSQPGAEQEIRILAEQENSGPKGPRLIPIVSAVLLLSFAVVSVALAQIDTQIPPTSGGLKADFTVSVIQYVPGSELTYFTVDTDTSGQIYYNQRVMNNNGGWTWLYHPSLTVVYAGANTSVALGDVLYDGSAPFHNPSDGQYYSFIMYFVSQPGACNGNVAGYLYVSFSPNGLSWTSPAMVSRPGGPTSDCFPGIETVPVEAVGAVYDGSGSIYLVGLEGSIGDLGNPENFNSTLTYLGVASTSNPTTVTLLGMISAAGVVTPNISGCIAPKYFANLGVAYNASTGYFYLTRGYAYPFDLGTVTPCSQPNCASGITTYPVRTQVYKMNIGPLSSIGTLLSGTWILVADWGNATGYRNQSNGQCQPGGPCVDTPLQGSQVNVGHDFGGSNIMRDIWGRVSLFTQLGHSYVKVFGGTGFNEIRTQADCQVTGGETVYYALIDPVNF